MRLIAAFIQLIRLPNLIFIALTQYLFHFTIVLPLFKNQGIEPIFSWSLLTLLIFSSVLIAAAGYIINDYFDINIDLVNKPHKNVIDAIINRRWAMFWHSLLSFIGVAIGFFVGWKINIWWIGPANFLCSFFLFTYSTTFKKRLLLGNIIISLLTGWTVALIGLSNFYLVYFHKPLFGDIENDKLFRLTILYSAFAFIISLIREAVKDMEDIEGDRKFGCTTLPIKWGMNAARIYVVLWLSVLMAILFILLAYVLQYKWWWLDLYTLLLIIIPLVFTLVKIQKARVAKDYHALSSLTKGIMFAGILSMIFFKFYL